MYLTHWLKMHSTIQSLYRCKIKIRQKQFVNTISQLFFCSFLHYIQYCYVPCQFCCFFRCLCCVPLPIPAMIGVLFSSFGRWLAASKEDSYITLRDDGSQWLRGRAIFLLSQWPRPLLYHYFVRWFVQWGWAAGFVSIPFFILYLL